MCKSIFVNIVTSLSNMWTKTYTLYPWRFKKLVADQLRTCLRPASNQLA